MPNQVESPRPLSFGAAAERRLADSSIEAFVPRTLRAALDDLASIAMEMDLIARCEYVENGCVKIVLSSCESELPEDEALAFLADCVRHRLKTLREDGEARSHRSAATGRQAQPAASGI